MLPHIINAWHVPENCCIIHIESSCQPHRRSFVKLRGIKWGWYLHIELNVWMGDKTQQGAGLELLLRDGYSFCMASTHGELDYTQLRINCDFRKYRGMQNNAFRFTDLSRERHFVGRLIDGFGAISSPSLKENTEALRLEDMGQSVLYKMICTTLGVYTAPSVCWGWCAIPQFSSKNL